MTAKGVPRHMADRLKLSRPPIVSPSRRPRTLSICTSRPRLALTSRSTPFERLRLVSGAKARATPAGPADPPAVPAKGGRSMSSVIAGLARTAPLGMKRPRRRSISDRSRRAPGAARRLTPLRSSSRASAIQTFGHGKAAKDAARGALQWRRGEAPNAALRLSPTLIAVSGQRTNPQPMSATINARAKPHATTRRMVSKSPLSPVSLPRRRTNDPPSHIAESQARGQSARTGARGREPASHIREAGALRPKGGANPACAGSETPVAPLIRC